MPSIFDFLFPQQAAAPGVTPAAVAPKTPSILDNPDYRSQRLTDTLLGMSQALVQAGAPSPYPKGFADAFGAAGMGAASGAAGGEDKYLKRAMVDSQVQKAQSEMAREKAWREMFTKPDAAQAAAPSAAPVATAAVAPPVSGGGPSNPTNPGNLADGKGGFQTFPTPEAGVAAAINLAKKWQTDSGVPLTLAQIEARWAPPDNGTDPMTKGNKRGVWSKNVATYMGVDPNTPLDFNDPAVAAKFAPAVHASEHGPGKAFQPDIYQRGVQMAYGGQPSPQAAPSPAGGAPGPVAGVPGQVAQSYGGPQGDAVPTPPADGSGNPIQPAQYTPPQAPQPLGQPVAPAQAAPIPQGPQTLQQAVQSLPPGVRQIIGTMGSEKGMDYLLKQLDPGHETAVDTTTGQVVFVPKTLIGKDPRFQPVKGAELLVAMRNAAATERQAGAREEANRIRGANEPMQPGATPGAPPTPTPGFAIQQGAIESAKDTAKVAPALLKYQGEEAIKDHQVAQQGAAKARQSNNNLHQLSTLLDGIDTGKLKSTTTEIKAFAKGLGIDLESMGIKDDVGNVQAAKALVSQMTLEMRSTGEGGGMPGSLSDSDRNFLTSMTPGIETTPEGRKLMIDYQKRLNQRVIDVAELKNKYVRSGKFTTDPAGMWDEVQKFADAHPLFDPAKDKMPTATPATAIPMNSLDAEIERRRKAAK